MKSKLFYFLVNGGMRGPLTISELIILRNLKKINDETTVYECVQALLVRNAVALGFRTGTLLDVSGAIAFLEDQIKKAETSGEKTKYREVLKELQDFVEMPTQEIFVLGDLIKDYEKQIAGEQDATARIFNEPEEKSKPEETSNASNDTEIPGFNVACVETVPSAEEMRLAKVYQRDLSSVCGAFVHLEVALEYAINSAHSAGEHRQANLLSSILGQVQRDGMATIALVRKPLQIAQLLRMAYDRGWNAEASAKDANEDFANWVSSTDLEKYFEGEKNAG